MAASALIRHIVDDLHQGADDFGVFMPLENLKQAEQTKRVFNIIIVVITGIALIVGGIGIMNIMLAAVTERTNEIDIRRAVGASRGNILGLDPAKTYRLDESRTLEPDRFHLTAIPKDFQLQEYDA